MPPCRVVRANMCGPKLIEKVIGTLSLHAQCTHTTNYQSAINSNPDILPNEKGTVPFILPPLLRSGTTCTPCAYIAHGPWPCHRSHRLFICRSNKMRKTELSIQFNKIESKTL